MGDVKFLKRRLTDKIRAIADAAWARGNRDLATDLHNLARKEEAIRKSEVKR